MRHTYCKRTTTQCLIYINDPWDNQDIDLEFLKFLKLKNLRNSGLELIILDYITKTKCSFRMEEWRKIIADCQNSGLKVDEWCEQNGVSRNSYYYWLRKIREKACQSVSSELLPIENESTFAKLEFHNIQSVSHPAVVLRFGYATIEVMEGTSTETVEAVLSALKKYAGWH